MTASGAMGSSGERTEISISRFTSSLATTGGKRASCRAALIAERTTVSARGPGCSTWPTQPRSRPLWCSVTKAPPGTLNVPVCVGTSGIRFSETTLTIARRASSSSVERSSLDSRDILGFLTRFEDPQAAMLLDAIVHAAPEFLKVLHRGNDCAPYHKPQQQNAERPKDCVFCRQDDATHRHHLQHHFRLPQS